MSTVFFLVFVVILFLFLILLYSYYKGGNVKNRKILIIILFALFALPIPLSLASWIGTIMAIAATGMEDWSKLSVWLQAFVAFSAYLLGGTYLITYMFSLFATLKRKSLSKISFLPLLHLGAFIVLFLISACLTDIFERV